MLYNLTPLRRILCCLLLSGVSFCAIAQVDLDSLAAMIALSEADSLQKVGSFEVSDEKAISAAEVFEKLKIWPSYVRAYEIIFYNGYYSGKYNPRIPLLLEGLNRIPESEPTSRARVNYLIAYSYDRVGNLFSSIAHYENCLDPLEAAGDTAQLAKIYGNLGTSYIQAADYGQSALYLSTAIMYASDNQSQTQWRNRKLLGECYMYGNNLNQASQAFAAAKMLRDDKDGTFEEYEAQILMRQGHLEQALVLVETGINNCIAVNGADSEDLPNLLQLKAECLLQINQPEQALQIYEQMLNQPDVVAHQREHGQLLILSAVAHRDMGNFDKALEVLQNATKVFLPDFTSDDPALSPELAELSTEIWQIDLFQNKGHCYWGKYQLENKLSDLELAMNNYQLSTSLVEKIKLDFGNRRSSIYLGSLTHVFYESQLKTTLALLDQTGDENFEEEAFRVEQRSKAFVLRDLVNENKAVDLAGISDAEQFERSQLAEGMLLIDNALAAADSNEVSSLMAERFGLLRQLEDSKKKWEAKYPRYNELRQNLEVATLKELQNGLNESSLLIKYFLGEKDLYIFSISQNDFQIDQITLPENFKKTILQYRRSISDLDFVKDSTAVAEQQYLESAHALFQMLLEKPLQRNSDANKKFTRLTIVADGLLNTIPFQALLLEPAERWTDATKMVVSKYALNYQYFCKNIIAEESERLAGDDFVAFGLEFDKHTLDYLKSISKDSIANPAILENFRSGALTRLPFSDEEAMALAEIMDGYYWVNANATKANFLEHSATADIIHLASHSILDDDQPEKSALVFTRPADNADNLLRLNEIYALDLRARLVVLSACNTAYGSLAESEGLISLARAYNVAGVPSVTATLWSVADEATKKIMELYYAFLQEGLDKDIALQKAQLEYLTNEEVASPAFRLPAYWAAWVSIGEKEAVVKKGVGRWVFGMIGMGMILVFVFWMRNGKLV